MTTHPRIPTYVGTTVDMPPAAATEAFVLTVLEAVLVSAPSDRAVAIRMTEGTLLLTGPGSSPSVPSRGDAWWPFWRAQGTLHARGTLSRVPIELELTPWSDDRTELGLRPRGPIKLGTRLFLDHQRYLRAAGQAVDLIAVAMREHRAMNAPGTVPHPSDPSWFTPMSHGVHPQEKQAR